MKDKHNKGWIILHPENGWRYCKDGKWREIALGGTFRFCVKIYKTQGHAQRQANRIKVNGKTHIISLGHNQEMDASGRIITTLPSSREGYELIAHDIKPHKEVIKKMT